MGVVLMLAVQLLLLLMLMVLLQEGSHRLKLGHRYATN